MTNARSTPIVDSPRRIGDAIERPISGPRGAPSTHSISPPAPHSQRNRPASEIGVGRDRVATEDGAGLTTAAASGQQARERWHCLQQGIDREARSGRDSLIVGFGLGVGLGLRVGLSGRDLARLRAAAGRPPGGLRLSRNRRTSDDAAARSRPALRRSARPRRSTALRPPICRPRTPPARRAGAAIRRSIARRRRGSVRGCGRSVRISFDRSGQQSRSALPAERATRSTSWRQRTARSCGEPTGCDNTVASRSSNRTLCLLRLRKIAFGGKPLLKAGRAVAGSVNHPDLEQGGR